MTAIIGFAGPGYGLLAVDRNIVGRHRDGRESILSTAGGKLHAGPDGYFAGAGKAELLAGVGAKVRHSTDPAVVARAMRAERKSRYAKRRTREPEKSFGVLLRKGGPGGSPGSAIARTDGPEVWVLKPEEGYRPELVPPGRPLVTGPEDPAMRPLIGAFRLLFSPTPGEESLSRNLDLLHLYFWLRHKLNPIISSDFDVAIVTPTIAEASTRPNVFDEEPQRAERIAAFLLELGDGFRALAKLVSS